MDSGVKRSSKILAYLRDSFWITLGLLFYAGAWNIFVLPHGFVGGGLGGICAMLYYLFGFNISLGYLGFNVILCAIALIILGREFSIKTVFGILGLVFFLWVIPWLFPELLETPVIKDKLLSAIAGGIIGGTGCAFYLLRGASTGGSDIVVMIISKYKNVSWGRVYLIFDACVISSSFFLPSSTLETVAYGFVFMGVSAYTIDLVSNGKRQSVQMFIFTSKYREVADQIIHRHHRGATLFESIGWYTKQHRKTIFLVAKKRESQEIFKTVKAIDENAFIAVSNVMSVFGMGFDAIKAGFSKAVLKDENGNVINTNAEKGESADADDDEMTSVFATPGGVVEVPVNESIMKDENDAMKRIKEGSDKTFNPNWQTPPSELMEIPEMPMIPKDMAHHAVERYESVHDLPKVER
ncbi:MAG: YitT family protein [Proteobacteria bacterium]|nr:YitT family protein [Pseudomonadota bacterium]